MVFIKQCWANSCKVVKNYLNETIWVKISSNNYNFLICYVYIPPEGSIYFRKGMMKELELEVNTISKEHRECSIILMGDFNSRIGQESGEILDIWDSNFFVFNSLLKEKKSKDEVINRNGKELLELCNNEDLFILNGRMKGDEKGELTCITSMGSSVVDYAIVSRSLLDLIDDFKVDNKCDSDHMPLVVCMKVESETEMNVKIKNERYTKITKYKWKDEKEDNFNRKIKEEYSTIYKIGIQENVNAGMIDRASEMLCDWIKYVCGDMRVEQSKRRVKKNGWFDTECQEKKKEMNSILRRFRRGGDEKDLSAYKKSKCVYKNLCDQKQKEWSNECMKKINTVLLEKNSKEFWKIVGVKRKEKEKCYISHNQWVEYYTQLLASEENEMLEDIGMKVFENEELDRCISKQEVGLIVAVKT